MDYSEILKRVEEVEQCPTRDRACLNCGVIGPILAKDVRELIEEFGRMENAWRAEVERLRSNKPARSALTPVNTKFLDSLCKRLDGLEAEKRKLVDALTPFAKAPDHLDKSDFEPPHEWVSNSDFDNAASVLREISE